MSEITIMKGPGCENDDFLINIRDFILTDKRIDELCKLDKYFSAKLNAFENKDTTTEQFKEFKNRPSLRNIDTLESLTSSIYTEAVAGRNGVNLLEDIITLVKRNLENHKNSRRIVVRFLNSYIQYSFSEDNQVDVSCLAFVHYFYINDRLNVRLVFRASDIRNELFYDIALIYKFFIKPIAEKVDLSIYATTAQNVEFLDTFYKKLKENLNE